MEDFCGRILRKTMRPILRSTLLKALVTLGLLLGAAFPQCASAEVSGAGPDETTSSAYGPLKLGVTYSGAFANQDDVDYLAFTITAPGETLNFTVQNTTQNCQDPNDAGCPVYATLMDSTGQNQVGGSDSDAGTIATDGDTEAFAWTFTQPRTYYVLMESDGDLPGGSPSYAIELAPATAGGGSGTGSSGGSGAMFPLVRSLKVLPHQRGRAVRATIVLGQAVARLRADVFLAPFHNGARSAASRIFHNLGRGIHRLSVRLPAAEVRELAQGQRLHLVLRITVTSRSGRRRTYTRRVTLSR